jgi:kinesin light chain
MKSFDLEPLCKRALEIREKCFGIDHPDVGKQLNNLALLCLNQGKYDKVEEYYKRAIDIYTKHYGPNDPNVAKTKNNLASAYLREGKYKLAAQLYQEVLSNEQCQDLSKTSVSIRDGSTVMTTLKNLGMSIHILFHRRFIYLGALCRRQGLYEQADYIESCATKSVEDPEAIDRALVILRQIRIYDDTNQGTIRRTQQQPPPQEYGRLRRSGSFQKLRQSIRRGSEKLVQKLRGTPTNLPSIQPQDATLKRASSMSMLNNVSPSYPLQQQQTNRTLTNTCSIDQQQQNKQQFIPPSRGRLTSAENIH